MNATTHATACSLALALSTYLMGCTDRTVTGDGTLVDERHPLPTFSNVTVESGLSGSIEPGDPEVQVHMDRNLQQYVEPSVLGTRLRVRARDDASLEPSKGWAIRIKTPALIGVELTEGSSFAAFASPCPTFPVVLSEGSRLHLQNVRSNEVRADVSEGSELALVGDAKSLVLKATDGSIIDSTVPAESARVELYGGSKIRIRTSRSIIGSARDGSEIVIFGHPAEVSIDTSDGSKVTFGD